MPTKGEIFLAQLTGLDGLSENTQRLIREHLPKKYADSPFNLLPERELKRLLYVFRGSTFSDAIFADPKAALAHIRTAIAHEIGTRHSSVPYDALSHTGQVMHGMDTDDVIQNLELINNVARKR